MRMNLLCPAFFSLCVSRRAHWLLPVSLLGCALVSSGQQAASDPDVLVLSNGDMLHGKLVSEANGKLTFHTDPLGDVSVPWKKVKELHTSGKFAVLDKTVKLRGKQDAGKIPLGPVIVENQSIRLQAENAPATVPVDNAAYIVDEETLNQQVYHRPNFFAGWDGSATAGATNVAATQNQNTFSGAVGVVRVVPSVAWLAPRNRTLADFNGSYGKITTPGSPTVKTEIFHAGAERDQYFTPRFYALAEVAFDHNFAQLLALQSIYGGGVGFTAISTPRRTLDFKGTIQYERQEFIRPPGALATKPSLNLVGSTFAVNYMEKWKLATFSQELGYVPSYNVPSAYSVYEANVLSFPVYKNFSFSLGTLDSYLNNPPASVPPTKRNSFQFTMGITYAFKSNY
jgi:hypothetical protein